jgi:hypothetical protein
MAELSNLARLAAIVLCLSAVEGKEAPWKNSAITPHVPGCYVAPASAGSTPVDLGRNHTLSVLPFAKRGSLC